MICFANLGNSGAAAAVPIRRLPSYRRNPEPATPTQRIRPGVVTWPVNPSPGLRPSSPRPETVRESDPGNADSLPGSDRAGLGVCSRRCRLRVRPGSGGKGETLYATKPPKGGLAACWMLCEGIQRYCATHNSANSCIGIAGHLSRAFRCRYQCEPDPGTSLGLLGTSRPGG